MNMSNIKILFILLFSTLFVKNSVGQSSNQNDIVQVTGVVLTADSQYVIPHVAVEVKNKNRRDVSSYQGVFSIACIKGDTLVFSSVGYKQKQFVVPTNIEGKFYSMTQLMAIDTFFLEEVIIKSYIPQTAEEFEYALRHWEMSRDMYVTASENTNPYVMEMLKTTLPNSGRELGSRVLQNEAYKATYGPQQSPQNIFNPFKWKEFYDALKRGDYKSIKK